MKNFFKENVLCLIFMVINVIIVFVALATHRLMFNLLVPLFELMGLCAYIKAIKEDGATVSNIISLILWVITAFSGICLTIWAILVFGSELHTLFSIFR